LAHSPPIMTPSVILWIYIVLLVVGGLAGFLKAKSKVSIIMSVAFAIPLALCAAGILNPPIIADVLIGLLVIIFAIRFAKTKKFMPGGMMTVVSALTLIARFLMR
jgi:uncharacterized membrane protein (UPF0136 family)